jgi:hypothetical protein
MTKDQHTRLNETHTEICVTMKLTAEHKQWTISLALLDLEVRLRTIIEELATQETQP